MIVDPSSAMEIAFARQLFSLVFTVIVLPFCGTGAELRDNFGRFVLLGWVMIGGTDVYSGTGLFSFAVNVFPVNSHVESSSSGGGGGIFPFGRTGAGKCGTGTAFGFARDILCGCSLKSAKVIVVRFTR